MKNLKLSDSELVASLKSKSQMERNLTVDIIELLAEVDRRKLYLELGFASLLEFCVKELKYSESSAYRRISTARLLKDIPEIKESISSGLLNLATVAQAHTFMRQNRKYNGIKYSVQEKQDFISLLEGKSKKECEIIFSEISPDLPKAETVRQIAKDKTEITLVVDRELLEKLEQLKFAYSHVAPGASYAEIIGIMADRLMKIGLGKESSMTNKKNSIKNEAKFLNREAGKVGNDATPPGGVAVQNRGLTSMKVETALQNKKPGPRSEENSPLNKSGLTKARLGERLKNSRYISAKVKRFVYEKAGGCCTFENLATGRRCSSQFQLEYDHRYPFALGGETSAENIRLVCRAHNQLYAKNLGL